jgi:fluoroquinolone resistance protein
LPLKTTQFYKCLLQEIDFTDSNLFNSSFAQSDLSHAIFENTNLEEASFETAINIQLNPSQNKVNKLKISIEGLLGLLTDYDLDIR